MVIFKKIVRGAIKAVEELTEMRTVCDKTNSLHIEWIINGWKPTEWGSASKWYTQ